MATKTTKREWFGIIKTLVPQSYSRYDELMAFVDKEIGLLDKKKNGSGKPTEKQIANDGYKDLILAYLATVEEGKTVTEIIKAIPQFADFSNQKAASLTTQLVNAGKLVKEIRKGRSYFSLAE